MLYVNLTPHPIRVYGPDTPDQIADLDDGLLFVIEPTAPPARLAMLNMMQAGHVYDEASGRSTWIDWQQFGQCSGMPARQEGTTFIVSLIVARDQADGRSDLIFPMSEVRNERGAVVGCRGFGRVC